MRGELLRHYSSPVISTLSERLYQTQTSSVYHPDVSWQRGPSFRQVERARLIMGCRIFNLELQVDCVERADV